MKRLFVFLVPFLISLVFLNPVLAKRSHKAHTHGVGEASIGVDGLVGELFFKVPAESVFGFEHKPKTDEEKKKVEESLKKIETEISRAFVFPVAAECNLVKKAIRSFGEGADASQNKKGHQGHSDIEGEFSITCKKDIIAETLMIEPKIIFPRLHQLKINILIGNLQKSEVVKGKAEVILK